MNSTAKGHRVAAGELSSTQVPSQELSLSGCRRATSAQWCGKLAAEVPQHLTDSWTLCTNRT